MLVQDTVANLSNAVPGDTIQNWGYTLITVATAAQLPVVFPEWDGGKKGGREGGRGGEGEREGDS